MKTSDKHRWLKSLVYAPTMPELLSKTEFRARFYPDYAEYRPQTSAFGGIRLNKRGRCIDTKPCHRKAQLTKREKALSEEYASYAQCVTAERERWQRMNQPELSLT